MRFTRTVVFLAISGSLWAGNLVLNGSFELSDYTTNHEFDTTFNSQGVTGWTGTGYSIYFVAGTQTTVSATGQWCCSEMLAAAATKLSPDGGNFIALSGDPNNVSTAYTTVAGLTPGQSYSLSFSWAASQLQSRTGITNQQIQAQLYNGSNIDLNYLSGSFTTPSQGFTVDQTTNNWFKVTLAFNATNTTETLKFTSNSTSTSLQPMVLLDGVQINTVPEPATITMLVLGAALLLIGGGLRRSTHI